MREQRMTDSQLVVELKELNDQMDEIVERLIVAQGRKLNLDQSLSLTIQSYNGSPVGTSTHMIAEIETEEITEQIELLKREIDQLEREFRNITNQFCQKISQFQFN